MKFAIIFGALTALSAATIPSAQAQEPMNYPWCAIGGEGARNCGFQSFAQCQSDISGVGWICQKNTQYHSESTESSTQYQPDSTNSIWPY
jgi:Protein of unknown function (DUF3551)